MPKQKKKNQPAQSQQQKQKQNKKPAANNKEFRLVKQTTTSTYKNGLGEQKVIISRVSANAKKNGGK